MMRPVRIISAAAPRPVTWGRMKVEPSSGVRPIRTNRIETRAFSEAIRRSQQSVRVKPTPMAGPLMAAMSGFERCMNAVSGSPSAAGRRPPSAERSRRRSAPEQKPRPAPVSTTAPTAGSSLHCSIRSRTRRAMSGDQALRRSGRLRVIRPTRPRRSKVTWGASEGAVIVGLLRNKGGGGTVGEARGAVERPWTPTVLRKILRLFNESIDFLKLRVNLSDQRRDRT